MPKRFTPEQFAASAAAGEPRSEQFFSGDSGAWHAYQDTQHAAGRDAPAGWGWTPCGLLEEGSAAAR